MNSVATLPAFGDVAGAALRREWLSHRLNRFLHAHLLLILAAGLLPLLTPDGGLARGAAWWLLHAVLYAVSLSALLLGLSSAHAESEEFVWLLGQPAGVGPWLAGKVLGLVALGGGSALLLGLPVTLLGGGSQALLLATLGAAGVASLCALIGLAIGFWVRDSVRGLIAAIAAWLLLLFGVDLLLLATAGAPWVQQHPDLWVAGLMLNPLDAYRVTILFAVENAAFGSLQAGRLTSWWIANAGLWLTFATLTGCALAWIASWCGARRRLDG
ncbi:MAG: hypothetical protein KBA71_14955 [Opitutaceae bacterium]|nr:hypothetical protein [Opitutaceae bacterium]